MASVALAAGSVPAHASELGRLRPNDEYWPANACSCPPWAITLPRMVKELDLFESNHGCGLNALSEGRHLKRT